MSDRHPIEVWHNTPTEEAWADLQGAWDEFHADIDRARDPEQRRRLVDRLNELEGDTSTEARRSRRYIRSVIDAAEVPLQPDPRQKITELKRQIAEHVEKLSHDRTPGARRLRKYLELQLESDAHVRRRLEQRELEFPSKGGRAPKRLPGIWQRVCDLVKASPTLTVAEAWKSIPELKQPKDRPMAIHVNGHTFEIYRDGNKLVEVEDRTGRERSITYDTFRGYLKAARKPWEG